MKLCDIPDTVLGLVFVRHRLRKPNPKLEIWDLQRLRRRAAHVQVKPTLQRVPVDPQVLGGKDGS